MIIVTDAGNDINLAMQSAAVFARAFLEEGINRYYLNLSRDDALCRLSAHMTRDSRFSLVSGEFRLLVAMKEKDVMGAAWVRSFPHPKKPLGKRFRLGLMRARAMLPLIPMIRGRRAVQLGKAMQLEEPILHPHLVLCALAVSPEHQGQGIGRCLLDRVHEESVRSQGMGTYLVTGDERNRKIFERSDYHMLQENQVGELTIYHMFRPNNSYVPMRCEEGE